MPSTPTLLRIDASARHEGSTSRLLADDVERAWLQRHPQGTVVRRDLAQSPVPHIESLTIEGYYTAPEAMTPALRQATALSDQLIAELKGADLVLIATPIYNFSVPSALKAWIDHVVRIGHTFAFDGQQFTGLVTRPHAVLALAYGADGYQGPLMAMDHLKPYLSQLLGFLGLQSVATVSAEATTGAPDVAQSRLQHARSQVPALFDGAA